ncbi:MAG: DUF4374 domain-containing protein [Chitinophagaceae bacterium]|nr:DUF4374 domain-containing protein [Chitinophagaceae bacterium]
MNKAGKNCIVYLFFIALSVAACGKHSPVNPDPDPNPPDTTRPVDPTEPDPDLDYVFVLTARQSSANVQGPSYLIETSRIDKGSIALNQAGWQADQDGGFADASIWFYPGNKAAYHFSYRQGPADVSSFYLDAQNKLQKAEEIYQMENGSGTFGNFGNKMVTIASHTDGIQYTDITFFDPVAKSITTRSIPSADIAGFEPEGEVHFAGIATVGNRFYSSMYVSGSKDSVWVVAFDENLNHRIMSDDRISYSAGRFRSIYFGQLDTDDDGNLYVFSSSFEPDTEKPSAALRINKGATDFDPAYYFNIEALTGGRAVYKVWHITGDYFLVQTYTGTAKDVGSPDVKKLGIANMKDKTFKWVDGIPADYLVTRIANTPCVHEGKILVSMTTSTDYPYIYTIDPATAKATQGLKAIAGDVIAIGKLNKK